MFFDEDLLGDAEAGEQKLEHGAKQEVRALPVKPPSVTYSIAGTWTDWHRIAMQWDRGHFRHEVTIGPTGWESFQVLLNGDWNQTFYPGIQDGSPCTTYKLRGPDTKGHRRNWTIGRPPEKRLWRNAARPGERYVILVSVDDRGMATGVTWRHRENDRAAGADPAQLTNDAKARCFNGSGFPENAAATLEWRPPATARAGEPTILGQAAAGQGQWLVSEARADMELGDIILLRPGDVVCGGKGLASRGGEVLRIEFVEVLHREEWLQALSSPVAPGKAGSGTSASATAAVGDPANGAAFEAELDVEIWRLPDVRGWGHEPAIKLKEPSSSIKVCIARGKTVWDLKEVIRGGLQGAVAIWDSKGQAFDDRKPLDEVTAGAARLFYEIYHDVRVYHGGPDSSPRVVKVSVKASATLYDVRAALVKQSWNKYCAFEFVEESEGGQWNPCNEDARLEGRSEVCAVGRFMEELTAYDVDEEAEVHLWEGPHAGKKVRCRIEGTSDAGEHYDIHILPTADYDEAGGLSDKYTAHIPVYRLRKSRKAAAALAGAFAQPPLTREQALELLRELLAGYNSADFKRRVDNLLMHYPDRTGYIPEAKYYTGFYYMRKQVLMSIQSVVLPRYGFAAHGGGAVMMVTVIKQFRGDPDIDGLGSKVNNALQPMYQEKLG